MMQKLFTPLTILAAAMLAYSPFLIANAPFEASMGLVSKIFYFHVPSWFAMFAGVFTCGIASAVFLFRGDRRADRVAASSGGIAVLFGLIGLVTGPLWARKTWGVWWQPDAHLTMAAVVELIFVGYVIVRKFGGPGSDKLAAGVAIFGMFNVPFVYESSNLWRTIHPQTTVVTTLTQKAPGMSGPFWYCVTTFMLLFVLLLAARMKLEQERALLDELYLAEEDAAV